MRNRSVAAATTLTLATLAFSAACFATMSGCVDDSAVVTSPTATGSTTSTTPGTKDDGGPGPAPDGGTDAPLVCNDPGKVCGGACVFLANDGKNCGECGHDCGGGACVLGACQPAPILTTNLTDTTYIAPGADGVYFIEGMRLSVCPLAGCQSGPVDVVTRTLQGMGSQIVVSPGRVTWAGNQEQINERPQIQSCPTPGACSSVVVVHGGGFGSIPGLTTHGTDIYTWADMGKNLLRTTCDAQGCGTPDAILGGTAPPRTDTLTVDDTGVYYINTAGVLNRCGLTGACTPTQLSTGYTSNYLLGLYAHKGILYFPDASDGSGRASISTCTSMSCSATTFFKGTTKTLGNMKQFAVDDSGVYWLDLDGSMKTCPLAGCGAAVPTFYKNDKIDHFRLYGDYVYFVTKDAGVAKIYRIRKPL